MRRPACLFSGRLPRSVFRIGFSGMPFPGMSFPGMSFRIVFSRSVSSRSVRANRPSGTAPSIQNPVLLRLRLQIIVQPRQQQFRVNTMDHGSLFQGLRL